MTAINKKKCSDPGVPTNGLRMGNDFTSGNRVTFKCSEGFSLIGEQQIVCQANGQWNQKKPLCIGKITT